MYSLRKFNGRTGNIGQPLPPVYDTFEADKIKFRHGATSLIAGAPGSYKSVLALNMLARWAAEGMAGLYFSMDSDEFTVAKRLASIQTGDSTDQFELGVRNGKASGYADALRVFDRCQFVYRNVDIEGVERHVASFEAVHGQFPDVIWIDNLMNTVDDPMDFGGMIRMILDLDSLARETKAHVMVLHHASESWVAPSMGFPPPRYTIQGKVSQIPRLVLTMGAHESTLRVACVKNTNGPQDPMARHFQTFAVEPSMNVEPIYAL